MSTTSGGTQRSIAPGRHRPLILPAAATLSSGGCMMGAGYLLHSFGWGISAVVMSAGGALIFIAFTLTPRGRIGARRAAAGTRVRTYAHGRGGVVGLPWQHGIAVMALTLGAGAAMMLAGYAAAVWTWIVLIPLVLIGGVAILAALVLVAKC
jgi:hypothetical protein